MGNTPVLFSVFTERRARALRRVNCPRLAAVAHLTLTPDQREMLNSNRGGSHPLTGS
jgi:hypothetical protein